MRQLTAAEVHAEKVRELGLDPSALDLTSTEAIAGALRRAASFLCPCAAATLVRSVTQPLRGLVDDLHAMKVLVEDTLEAMVSHGDILEHRDVEEGAGPEPPSLLYAAPASFIARQSGAVILLGISTDQLSALPPELEGRVEYMNHVRRLSPVTGEDLRDDLVQLGLIEVSYEGWLNAPPYERASQHVSRFDRLLSTATPSREVPGLVLLDPERAVRYYRGRWVEPRSQSGNFVGRRSQAYGAQLWCYVQLRDGNPERLVDLPLTGSRWRGCDEAWRLQIAIDARRGEPQRFRIRPGPDGTQVIQFYSPIPMWARRRWDAIAEPVPSTNCLFAYKLAEVELGEELSFAREWLWLDELTESRARP